MLLAAMLINAFHATFEDAVVARNRIRVDRAAHVFIGFVTDALMACEVVAETKEPLSRQSLADLVRRAQATSGKGLERRKPSQ